MQVDEVKRKVDILRAYLDEFKPLISLATEELLSDDVKLRAIERLFQLIVDEAVDINTFILMDTSSKSPDSYRSTFYFLSQEKFFDYEFADKISYSAKIRNQIVHDYEKMEKKFLLEEMKRFYPMYEKYVTLLIGKLIS